jgi:hypothetical protein
MPFGLYGADSEVLRLYRENTISVIVLLAEEVKCLRKVKGNLYYFYLEQGFRVIHLPIAHFIIPPIEELGRDDEVGSIPDYLDGACAALLTRVALQSAVLSPALSVPCMVLPFTRPLYCAPPAVKSI